MTNRRETERIFIRRIRSYISNFNILKDCIKDCLVKGETQYFSANLNPEDFLYQDGSVIISNRPLFVGSDIFGRYRRRLYSPIPDLAFAPFNLQEKTAQIMSDLCECVEKKCSLIGSFIKGLLASYRSNIEKYQLVAKMNSVEAVNMNPRSLITVEVCFSGSMKHTFGSLINASILGYYGVLVTNDSMLPRALRLKYYLLSVTEQKKIKVDIGKNLIIITNNQMKKVLKELKGADNKTV